MTSSGGAFTGTAANSATVFNATNTPSFTTRFARRSFADVYNSCFVPGLTGSIPRTPPAECAGEADSFSITVGDQVSYAGFVWDSMSREYWISTALDNAGVDVQMSCQNSEAVNFCGGASYWNGVMCEACPVEKPMMKYGAQHFSLADCVSCEEFLGVPARYVDGSGACLPYDAFCADDEELVGDKCVPLCREDEHLVKIEVENRDACNTLVWNRRMKSGFAGTPSTLLGVRINKDNDESPHSHLTFDNYFTYEFHESDVGDMPWHLTCREQLRTVHCEYRPEGDAGNALTGAENGWLATLFGVMNVECCNGGYCDATNSPYLAAGHEISGPRDLGACWRREYNSDESNFGPVGLLFSSGSNYWFQGLEWDPEDLYCGDDKVRASARGLREERSDEAQRMPRRLFSLVANTVLSLRLSQLRGGDAVVYDSSGALLLTLTEEDFAWNSSSTNSAIGQGHMCVPSSAASGPLRIQISPHVWTDAPGMEDISVKVANGPFHEAGMWNSGDVTEVRRTQGADGVRSEATKCYECCAFISSKLVSNTVLTT